jgi:hypothetical protein
LSNQIATIPYRNITEDQQNSSKRARRNPIIPRPINIQLSEEEEKEEKEQEKLKIDIINDFKTWQAESPMVRHNSIKLQRGVSNFINPSSPFSKSPTSKFQENNQLYSQYIEDFDQSKQRRIHKSKSEINWKQAKKLREEFINSLPYSKTKTPYLENRSALKNTSEKYKDITPKFQSIDKNFRKKLSPRSKLRLNMHESTQYKSKMIFYLCCCCFRIRSIINIFFSILINDILLSANFLVFGYITTFNLLIAIPSFVYFIICAGLYVYWNVNN